MIKAKLIKKNDTLSWYLKTETPLNGVDMACYPHDITKQKLSLENCDEIFGVVDVDLLATQHYKEYDNLPIIRYNSFTSGAKTILELNKDKLFTLEQVIELAKILFSNPYKTSGKTPQELVDSYIQSLQQPIEIEVEIEMESTLVGQCNCPCHTNKGIIHSMACCNPKIIEQPKLDSEGCLILKRVV